MWNIWKVIYQAKFWNTYTEDIYRIMCDPTSCCLIYVVQQIINVTCLQEGNKMLIKVTRPRYYKKETFTHSSINANSCLSALLEIALLVISKYTDLNQFYKLLSCTTWTEINKNINWNKQKPDSTTVIVTCPQA